MSRGFMKRLDAAQFITDDWADIVTNGADSEYRRIRDAEGQEAADVWLKTQPVNVRRIARKPRIPSAS